MLTIKYLWKSYIQENINECVENECLNNSTCVDGVNKYSCDCLSGFSGDFCETDINECDARLVSLFCQPC